MLAARRGDADHGSFLIGHGGASGLLQKMKNFEYVFVMYFLIDLLGITNALSLSLQKKDKCIVEAMGLIVDMKVRLQDLRDNECEPMFNQVRS